jgi:Kelch motif/Galactose oxidase, central domain
MKIFLSLLVLRLISIVRCHSDHSLPDEHWHTNETSLPSPISDHSATLDPDTGKVYLVGGCNNTNGNIRLNGTGSEFFCPTVTNAGHVFDIPTGRIDPMPDAPHKRYRHAAIFHQGLIWYFGGRDDTFDADAQVDSIVYDVDIFDTTTGKWRDDLTFQLSKEIARSDQAAFVIDHTIYLVGGYELGYNATADTIAIDIPLSLASKTSLNWTKRASLNQERGDCYAAVVENGDAYVVGGFTHEDGWCNALDVVERYSPMGDVWMRQDSLTYGRADKAVVTIGSKIYAIGGESKTDRSKDPGQRTTPTTEVEVLDTADPNGVWTGEIADIPSDHFRFTAVSYDDIIYTFGGQKYYNSECDCFSTTASILTIDVDTDYSDTDSGAASLLVAPTLVATVALVLTLL